MNPDSDAWYYSLSRTEVEVILRDRVWEAVCVLRSVPAPDRPQAARSLQQALEDLSNYLYADILPEEQSPKPHLPTKPL